MLKTPTLRGLRRALERELGVVVEREDGVALLKARALRALRFLAQDVRGLPMRVARARRLRAELRELLPWPASERKRVLLAGHLGPVVESPTVSVIVPAYGELDSTVLCLLSLGACDDATPFEIIVVDDASTDASQEVLSRCPGIRYLRNESNSGFIVSCNRGAGVARGEHLHFLNNDTVVLPGWLDQLVATMGSVPRAGLVGSRLIYPRLALQEAGGIVWRDGSASNWGNGRDPWNPSYCTSRDVDYCSAASILVPRELFERLGGFDPRYAPAYYEDTDLAFRVREAGRRVIYQPASRVIHREGATSGVDLDSGPKRHQVINRGVFQARWAEVLQDHGGYGDTGPRELDRFSRSSVLVLGPRTPEPDRDAGSVNAINMLRVLRSLRCRVTFVPVLPLPRGLPLPNVQWHGGRYTEALQAMGVECPHLPYEPSVERLLRERGEEFDLVVLTRARVADRFLPTVRRLCPRAKVLFDTVDLTYLREQREARHRGSTVLAWKAADTRRRELRAIAGSDVTTVLSEVEAQLLARELPEARVRLVPLLCEIPGRGAPREGRTDLLFVGGFRHRPNADAVEFLVGSIWPHLRDALPGVRLHIVGSSTPQRIFAMASDRIVVHGHVPDLASIYGRVCLSVAPLRFGAGLKGKVAESLGYGVPCVTTSLGAEGSGLRHGEHLLVADDPAAFAREVARAYTDAALWETLSAAGLAYVRSTYSLDAHALRFGALLAELEIPFVSLPA